MKRYLYPDGKVRTDSLLQLGDAELDRALENADISKDEANHRIISRVIEAIRQLVTMPYEFVALLLLAVATLLAELAELPGDRDK